MKNKDLGFNPKNILVVETPPDTLYLQDIRNFSNQLKNLPGISLISETYGGAIPGKAYGGDKMLCATEINGELKQFMVSYSDIDQYYFDLMEIDITNGEGFSDNGEVNKTKRIINESYANALGISKNPIGELIPETENIISGLVKDFHFLSPHNPIEPICFRFKNDGYPRQILIKYDNNIFEDVKKIWSKTIPDYPFLYKYLGESYQSQYMGDKNLFKLIGYFTLLSILISLLGLTGLIKYTCEQRIKEIGIRKVCGAKTSEILSMINKEFIKWIIFAYILSYPIAWYVINKWLEGFAYKTNITWHVFALAAILSLLFAILTVSYQSIKVANSNPANSLRYE